MESEKFVDESIAFSLRFKNWQNLFLGVLVAKKVVKGYQTIVNNYNIIELSYDKRCNFETYGEEKCGYLRNCSNKTLQCHKIVFYNKIENKVFPLEFVIHNIHSPALISRSENKYYFKNGFLHRNKDLPAIEYKDGGKIYYKNDKIHRDGDLPAVEFINGHKEYYKNGIKYYP